MSFNFKIIFFSCILIISYSHYIKKINDPSVTVSGYTNQSQQLPIPFKKCFKVVPQLQANSKYINFKPSSLSLNKQTSFMLQQNHNISLLQSLRTAISRKHKAMAILQQQKLIMLYSIPNKILIIKEIDNKFQLIDQYRIQQMKNTSTPFKLYKFSQSRSIMIIQNHKNFYILDNKGYQQYSLPVDITFAHLDHLQNEDILIAQFNKGLGHYRLNHQSKSIDLIKLYKKQDLGLQESYIVDVNTNFIDQGEIYVLDAKEGLIKLKYNKQTKQISNPELIVHQSNCEAFDSIQNDYFVMLCQIQGYSSIIEIYKTKQNKKIVYQRLQPTYFSTFFTDIQVSNLFYMIFSNKQINVFWNTKKNRLPQTLDSQSHISIPGLQTFKLIKKSSNKQNKMYLYTVQSGTLVKYLIQESPPKLYFRSQQPIYKNMTIYIYGSCQQIGQNTMQVPKQGTPVTSIQNVLPCQIKKQVMLSFQDQIYNKTDDFSISASIIVLLIMIFLVIIWICLKKYKGLQKQARKVLQVYKRKKGNQQRAI